ncbi:DUF1289 domain-containing protein [Gemmobacter sp.]|uniref:DUF1289 domain-containing protein n=1 Tax=Gemmobacter sp. TaxID=1898957 RepID=UPI002AFF065B|nr:DUF1289 domain-containing protein [Gemmobacter sp.]
MSAESPCINVCQLDAAGEICLGCQRTLDEIALWSQMAPAERRRIMADLPLRGLEGAGGRSRDSAPGR